jgi:pimeloyl-ACP methyl ester carboxylesterase
VIGDNHEALAVSRALDAEGLWVPAIRPPTVPKGAARLRITLSAAHSFEQVDRLVATLKRLEASPNMTAPIVLLHGWGLSSKVWAPLQAQLPAATAPRPPRPRQRAPAGDSLAAWAEALVAQLPDGAVLVGWSLGAQLALHIAAQHPHKAARLVLIAATPRFVQAPTGPPRCPPPPSPTSALTSTPPRRHPAPLHRAAGHGRRRRRDVTAALNAALTPADDATGRPRHRPRLLADTDLRASIGSVPSPCASSTARRPPDARRRRRMAGRHAARRAPVGVRTAATRPSVPPGRLRRADQLRP